MAVLGFHWCEGFSLAAASGSCTLDASHCPGFSCCGARTSGVWAQWLQLVGSVVLASGLSCSVWDLPRPGTEPRSPALADRFLTSGPPGKVPKARFLL